MSDDQKRSPNRLIREKSPYLLQHAFNPVDWYPWGDEALKKAKQEDKPIFLSIGYSTCHWCHVMEKESYEDPETAKLINDHFVPVKVDREERPDLDEIYMKSVMSLTGHGGWPLNVFLTPDLRPFYGGTYFPPIERQGIPSFGTVLSLIIDAWKRRRGEVFNSAESVMSGLKKMYRHGPSQGGLPGHILDAAFVMLADRFDENYGGFGGAPKFPTPSNLLFLLRYHLRSKNNTALRSVQKTLEAMSNGGINDQLAGGFHRYSVDRLWLIPHFEKMLYDNALLSRTYLEAYQLTGMERFAVTAGRTLDWILREMSSKGGGFYSAQDADSPEGEGFYYVWSKDELLRILGPKDGPMISEYFGVKERGNFEDDKSVLSVSMSYEDLARKNGITVKEVESSVRLSSETLLHEREKRTKPSTDDKVLTSWNGLAISAFSLGYQALEENRYLAAAEKAAGFLLKKLVRDRVLLRRYRDGEAGLEGTIEDYAFFINALMDLYEADFQVKWIEEAIALTEKMIELFWDSSGGGFFFNPPNTQDLIVRIKEAYDGATPSGNSVAALNILKLAEYTGNHKYREIGEKTLKAFGSVLDEQPTGYPHMLCALDFFLSTPKEVVIAGDRENVLFSEMLREIRKKFIPNKVVALASEEAERVMPFVKGKVASKVTAYVCENFSCKMPSTTVESLREALSGSESK